jgi:crotonobetainyl-CoA:carnitine CoA-transferase CaiB-like acyl-CoA transferase
VRSPAPWTVGGDTDAVLADVGVDDDQIEQLRRDGVL